MRTLLSIGASLCAIVGCTVHPVIREAPTVSVFSQLLTEATAPVLLQQDATLGAIKDQTESLTEIKSLLTDLSEGKKSCTPAGPTDTKDLPPAPDPAPVPVGVRLQFWSATWCVFCPDAKAEAKAAADSLGVKLEEFDWDTHADQRSKCKIERVPTLCIVHNKMTRKWLVGKHSRDLILRSVEKVLGAEVAGLDLSSAPVRMKWNVQGDWTPTVGQTAEHLQGTHGVSTEGMSLQQMLDLHDSLHGSAVQTRRVRLVSRGVYCPSGRCPR
jgi:thiol-disulfide isomerase/thioredoxin